MVSSQTMRRSTLLPSVSLALVLITFSLLPFYVQSNSKAGGGKDSSNHHRKSNSTIDDIYDILQVQPASPCPFPRWKRWSWKWHSRLLPLLHFGPGNSARPPPDVFVNLRVLWNKALTSIDPKSPAYEAADHFPTFHLLPHISRWILFRGIPPLRRLYPRWFHANIELRTVYLNRAIETEVQHIIADHRKQNNPVSSPLSIELIILGGGYDTRSVRTLFRYPQVVTRVWELDFESVVESKQTMLQQSLYRQVPELMASTGEEDTIRFQAVDLNDLERVESILAQISREQKASATATKTKDTTTHTIILTEAVLMYLEDGVPPQILQLCLKHFDPTHLSWIFVDRLKGMNGYSGSRTKNNKNGSTKNNNKNSYEDELASSRTMATDYLASIGWQLVDLLIKPGATRHMGVARPLVLN